MSSTGYRWRAGAPAATGYVRLARPLVPVLRAALPAGLVGDRVGDQQAFRPFLVDGAGYGGLVGDVVDAGRLAALRLGDGALAGRRVLSPEAAQRMRTIATPGKPFDLGLGWFRPAAQRGVSPAFVEHLGSGGGYCNVLRIYPELDLGVAVMANTTRSYDHHAICTAAATTAWA